MYERNNSRCAHDLLECFERTMYYGDKFSHEYCRVDKRDDAGA